MAIKINLMPKKEGVATSSGSRRPFYFIIVFIIFIISCLVYFGIYSYNAFFLEKQLDIMEKETMGIQEDILKISTVEKLSTVAVVVTKGENIRSILVNHFYKTKIYELLERLTIKSVTYIDFSEKIDKDNLIVVSISGEADSFNALAKQLVVFKKSKEIKEIIFKEALMGKNGKVLFSVVLRLDSRLVIIQPVITLVGPGLVEVIKDSNYSDVGATAIDGIDGVIDVTKTGLVDTSVVGTYTLTYKAVNTAGNFQTAVRMVNVVAPKDAAVSE